MSVLNAMLTFIGCVVIFAAIILYCFYVWDKRKFCSNATVEHCDGKGSIVMLCELNGFTLYYVKKKLKVGSTVKILDPKKIEAKNNAVGRMANFYLFLHGWRLSCLQKSGYRLAEAVYCCGSQYQQAEIKRLLDRGTALCVNVKTGKPVIVHNIPRNLTSVVNNVINYDELALTPPISVTEIVS